MANNRTERLNEEIKKTLSGIIFDMKDPRISAMTTISECSVTRDLKYCKVSVSVYDTDEQARKDTIATLNNASGHIGWELGSGCRSGPSPSSSSSWTRASPTAFISRTCSTS